MGEDEADRFLTKFKGALEALKPGDPLDKATTLGPLSTEGALVKLLEQVKRGRKRGHACTGWRSRRSPWRIHAADNSNRRHAAKSRVPRGVLRSCRPLFRVENEDEAVLLANDSEFGLGRGGTWSAKERQSLDIAVG